MLLDNQISLIKTIESGVINKNNSYQNSQSPSLNYSLGEKKIEKKRSLRSQVLETKSLKEKLSEKNETTPKFKFDKKMFLNSINKSGKNFSERSSFNLKNNKSPILQKMVNSKKYIISKSR